MATTVRPRTTTTGTDRARVVAVLVTAVLQVVVGGLGGSGAFGMSVGRVADEFTTPIMPGAAAFSIWGPIYAWLLVLAVRQALPGQHARAVHRATGWWLTAAALANAGWILAFSLGALGVAELIIVALLVCLAVTLGRLARRPAEGWADRLTLHAPVAFYAGWVSLATVVGTATTGAWFGLQGTGAVAQTAGIVVLLVTGAIAAWVVSHAGAALAYTASVVWGLGWIVAVAPVVVALAAALAALGVLAALAARVARSRDRVAALAG